MELAVPFDSNELTRYAFLLDVDGTLLDIAPTPPEVVVPPSLPPTLRDLSRALDGALALVSGRTIGELDAFFAPLQLPAVGGHGAEMRLVAGAVARAGTVSQFDVEFKRRLNEIADRHPGVLIEDKGYSLALHYRQVPKQGVSLIHDVKHAYESWGDKSIELLTGKAVLELKFAGFDKGTAVRQLMTHAPFKGRIPIFVGDDHTDEHAFKVMPEFGGHFVSVGRKLPGAERVLPSPSDVRAWLASLCVAEIEAVS